MNKQKDISSRVNPVRQSSRTASSRTSTCLAGIRTIFERSGFGAPVAVLWLLFLTGFLIPKPAEAQFIATSDEQDMFVITREDGDVYVYHTVFIGLVNGFHVDRRVAGGEWERITEEPVYPVSGGTGFVRMIGEDMFTELQEITGQETSQQVFLSMKMRQNLNFLGSVLFPDVARALGNLYIDRDAPIGRRAEYRFVIVNTRGEPTGNEITGSFNLQPAIPAAPRNFSVSNEGPELVLEWEYPSAPISMDGVSEFRFYERREGRNIPLTPRTALRIGDKTRYTFRTGIEAMNRSYTLFVVAADAAGQEGDPSNTVTIVPEDNIPPAPVVNIDLHRLGETRVEVSWNVSTDLDAAGYHVFRMERNEEDFTRLTDQLLDVFENVFVDTTIAGSSHYSYKIQVYDRQGNESEPSNISSILIEAFTPPEPPRALDAALQDDGMVQLRWGASPTGDIVTYNVIRREIHPETGRSYARVNDDRTLATELRDPGLSAAGFPEGRTFEYGVSAVGPSAMQSDTIFAVVHIPLVTPPEPPPFTDVTPAEGGRININWQASPSSTVTGYEVHRILGPVRSGAEEQDDSAGGRPGSGGFGDSAPGDMRGDTAAGSGLTGWDVLPDDEELARLVVDANRVSATGRGNRFVRDEKAVPGNTYQYVVTAVDSAGNRSQPALTEAVFYRSTTPPQPVRNIQARVMDGNVAVQWEPVRAQYLAGYVIYRSRIATGGFERVAEVEAGQTRWTDRNGEAGNWYRVYAVDTSENKSRRTRAIQATR
jgi:fibronectin type 3 domain-containing protein